VERDERFMRMALAEAAQAAGMGEVPVGAVVVRGDTVIAAACNRRETTSSALAHAELLAIEAACRALGGWRLWECELYVTLEPCPMCAGAIINARLRRVVFGASDPKAGCCGSVLDLFALPFNHRPEMEGGLLAEESAELLRSFFRARRGK
jgi:tRNA(adenine34) deaminase